MTKPRPKTRSRPVPATLTLVVDDSAWRKRRNAIALIRRGAKLALSAPPQLPRDMLVSRAATILLANDARLRDLNRTFRGKNKATNVLSFPASEPGHLGDIALGLETVSKEARAQGKAFAAHAAHLAIHGVLHLLGYDHGKKTEAAAMESLEIQLLARLGLGDPYAPVPYTRARKAA